MLEAPAAQARITGPSRPTPSGRAQTQRTESLRSPRTSAASRAACLPDPDTHGLAAPRVLLIEVVSQRGAVGLKRFQLLPHSSADGQDFAQNWMCWALFLAEALVYFG